MGICYYVQDNTVGMELIIESVKSFKYVSFEEILVVELWNGNVVVAPEVNATEARFMLNQFFVEEKIDLRKHGVDVMCLDDYQEIINACYNEAMQGGFENYEEEKLPEM